MDLVERYLQAVEFWLPKQQKHDITAELSEDIHAQIEEEETALGRGLNEDEVSAILKQRGRPMLVANRYSPQESLIGPVLFPIYRFVLKITLACYLISWVLTAISVVFFHFGYGSEQRGAVLLSTSRALWLSAFVAMGIVTIVFGVLERVQAKSRFLENWNPRKLPAVRQFSLIKRSASSMELAVNVVVAIWWAANMSSPIVVGHPEMEIPLSPLWSYFYWGFLCLTLTNAGLAAINLMRPHWTPVRAAVRLLTDCAGSALFCWLLKANVVTGFAIGNLPQEKALQMATAVNVAMANLLPWAIVVALVIAVWDVFRIVRVRTFEARSAASPVMRHGNQHI